MRVYMPVRQIGGGKGEFLKRLAPHLEDLGVRVTNRLYDRHDIALHVARSKGYSSSKRVIRVDGVSHDTGRNWKRDNRWIRESVQAADGVIYQSQYAKELCDRYLGKPLCKTTVILNGADPKFYQRLEKATSLYRYNFVASAKWHSHKRLRDMMLAFIKADIDNSCLWIAGDMTASGISRTDQALQDAIARYGLHNKQIEFLGHINQKVLGTYLKLCDAFIHLCSHDACPNSVVEAVCAGKVAITSNIGGTPEIAKPGGGILCDIDAPWDFEPFDLRHQPPIDHSPVVRALRRVVRQTALKKKVSWEHVDIRQTAQQYTAFFESVLSVSQPTKPRRKSKKKTGSMEVGHICRYLGSTETFIYSYLAHAQRSKPLVLTDVMRNMTSFPIACSYLFSKKESQAPWVKDALAKLDYPNCFEGLIQERGIRVLHAHFGGMGYAALRLKRKLNIPLVTTFYGYDASGLLQIPEWQWAFQGLFRDGDLFLALGQDMVRRLAAAGCPKEKIEVLHLGVDMGQIRFKQRKWPKGQVVLLYCGRLVEKKGVLDALHAFFQLSQKWKNLVFRIVGEGPLHAQVEQVVRRLKLQDRVVLVGPLPHHEVLQEMQRAHLFVLPSLTASNGDMEGTPTVLIEAQASGLPVISTYHADIPEVVVDGKTGFLAPERDRKRLAEHIDALMVQPELWGDMGWAGRCHVEQNYNIHKEVDKLESLYEQWLV